MNSELLCLVPFDLVGDSGLLVVELGCVVVQEEVLDRNFFERTLAAGVTLSQEEVFRQDDSLVSLVDQGEVLETELLNLVRLRLDN